MAVATSIAMVREPVRPAVMEKSAKSWKSVTMVMPTLAAAAMPIVPELGLGRLAGMVNTAPNRKPVTMATR